MKVWITKYALTDGIKSAEASISDVSPSMITYGKMNSAHGEGKDWHRTFDRAVERAETMRGMAIESHRKSIAKLEAMKF